MEERARVDGELHDLTKCGVAGNPTPGITNRGQKELETRVSPSYGPLRPLAQYVDIEHRCEQKFQCWNLRTTNLRRDMILLIIDFFAQTR